MNKLILLAGAGLVLALGTPAAADAKPGKGNSANVHLNAKGYVDMNRNGVADWREQRLIDANGNGILDWRERRTVDINRNGVADWRERWIDRDRDGIDDRQEIMANRWGGANCPPGLAKKIHVVFRRDRSATNLPSASGSRPACGTIAYNRIPLRRSRPLRPRSTTTATSTATARSTGSTRARG